ncbi:anaerobic ribonucleoside-triphosphate reductase [Candidatus Woesearchaeota archaeon]|nr:anaerobic ribonucleoside-triphosphate reductase [Candidatus Woesearchaeota archaeon]
MNKKKEVKVIEDIEEEKKVEETRCPVCGKPFSEDNPKCPHCGRCSECCECGEP